MPGQPTPISDYYPELGSGKPTGASVPQSGQVPIQMPSNSLQIGPTLTPKFKSSSIADYYPHIKESQTTAPETLPQTPPDWLRYLTKAAGFALPMVGAAVGSTIGPEGTIAGGVIGGLAGQSLGRYGEGKGPTPPSEAVLEAARSAVLGKATELAAPVVGKAAGKLIKLFQKAPESKLTGDTLQKALEFGAKDTEPLSPELERALQAGVKTQADVPEAISRLQTEVTGSPYQVPKTVTGAAGQKAIIENMAATREATRALYKKFEDPNIPENTVEFNKVIGEEPGRILDIGGNKGTNKIIANAKVEGPIYTSTATKYAAELKPTLDAQVGGPTFSTLEPWIQRSLLKAKEGVDSLVEGLPSVSPTGEPISIPVKPWATVKDIRTNINRAVGGKVFPDKGQAIAQNLESALEQDITDSISNTWKNGPKALEALNKADAAYHLERTTFPPEIVNRVFGKGNRFNPADSSEFFDTAFKRPETAQRMMNALTEYGPENAQIARTHYFENELLPKGADSLKSAIAELKDPNSVSRIVFNANTRNNMLQTMESLAAVPKATPGQSLVKFGEEAAKIPVSRPAMLMQGGKLIFSVLRLPGNIVHGNVPSAAYHASVAIDAGKVLMNARVANMASRLAKIPASSAEASSRTRLIFSALKGLPVSVTTDLGTSEGELTENGGVKIK